MKSSGAVFSPGGQRGIQPDDLRETLHREGQVDGVYEQPPPLQGKTFMN